MRFLLVSGCCLTLAGCMVGPHFHRPIAPVIKQYTSASHPSTVGNPASAFNSDKTQYFIDGRDVPAEWWKLFHSPPLNQLISDGLANNPTLQAAKAALHQAQEAWNAQAGSALLPRMDSAFNGERQRDPASSSGSSANEFNLYNASVSVSYTLDLFGGARRELESYAAQIDYQHFQLEATYLTLIGNIVTTTITVAALEAQISALQQILESQEKQLTIVNKQFKLGAASGVDAAAQETQVAQTRALLPPLKQNLAKAHNALASLVGKFPSEMPIQQLQLDRFNLPKTVPLSVPSSLVQQRPDIRAQEALLHVASAKIGVATANLLPQITLTGRYGWNSAKMAELFSPTNVLWQYGAGLLQPIFRGGALQAERRAAIAAYQQAAASYRETVLNAFQNVADTLEALNNDAIALCAQRAAETAAQKTLHITEKQYQLGGTSYLALLNAQRQYQQSRISRLQAQAARLSDTAALYQALGGGWWNRNTKTTPQISYRRFHR